MAMNRYSVALVLASALLPTITHAQTPAAIDPARYAQLRYRYIGPVGNRVSAVVGVPGDINTYYVGAASGGIWKSVDAGVHWTSIFDDMNAQSIGALAVAPSNPSIVWAGTGESWIRSHISLGNGIYKSADTGKTWTLMGLENTGRIARVVVHPSNPDMVFVAALGHSYGPQQERGVYRTVDGGKTWQRVLFVDVNTGAVDVAMDPTDPNTLFAAMWQLEIRAWGRESGGPGSALFVSHDGGTTWTKLAGHGLPVHEIGKTSLAFSKSNPKRLYALIETGDGQPVHGKETDRGELWRSDDSGVNWQVVSYERNLGCRQPYYTRVVVATDNENEAYFMCTGVVRTLDGGVTFDQNNFASPGGDNHDMWIDPGNANRMIVANDGGASISTTRGANWQRVQLPIAQIYHVTVDNRVPYYVYGNKQDGPSYRGPSNTRAFGNIARSEWHGVAGGESGFATPDTVDENIVWSTASGSGSVGGIVTRMDLRTRQAQNVEVWPLNTGGYSAAEVKYRFVWDAPFLVSPHDHNKVYMGSQFVHASTDAGKSWQLISPDLTLNDKTKQGSSGGLTPDNIGVEYGDVIHAITESPIRKDLLWVGTNDGLVQVSRDGGKTWTNVTPRQMPSWGDVRKIEASRYDAATAYVAVDGHQANNRDPWLFKTTDYGKTWTLIVTGIPRSPLSYTHVVREDPVRRGLLFAGTENALYVSFNDGALWQPLQNNLPHAPVYDIQIQKQFGDLVLATYGRGFWILDDIAVLRQLTPAVAASNAQLFAPRAAYRFRAVPGNYSVTYDPTEGDNPPYGAVLNYWLAGDSLPDVKLNIEDAGGKVLRTLNGVKNRGLNRMYWDLRSESTREARLRTVNAAAPEIALNKDGWRVAPGVSRSSMLVPPGTYTVRMKVGTQEFTQPLVVLKDPNSGAGDADITAATTAMQDIQDDMNKVADMVNTIETTRAGLQKLPVAPPTANAKAYSDAKAAAAVLDAKLAAVEENLFNSKVTGHGQDGVRYPGKLGSQLSYLAGQVGGGDFAPTSQQRDVAAWLKQQVQAVKQQLDALQSELNAFNQQLKVIGVPEIVTE